MKLPRHIQPSEESGEEATFKIKAPVETAIGLGDVVKNWTSEMGFEPCGGCNKRAEMLNRWVQFSPSRRR